ncbi:phosphoglycerate mutase family protein [Rutstroemia sp. NJR-2017a WRK4]|nr:phosphoglycerate mutase family protein [Rutstroemia sp. NJR-2017a WRK4]
MPNSLVAAAPNASGTENLLASSHLTEDNLAKHEAQEATQSSIPLRSSGLDEVPPNLSVCSESQEDEDEDADADASIYHDAAESLRSPSPVQRDFLVDPIFSDATQSIRSSSSVQTAIWVGPTHFGAVESTPSSSLPQRATSEDADSPTTEYFSDDSSDVSSSDGNSSLVSLGGSRRASPLELNVEKITSEFDVQVTTVESSNASPAKMGSADQGGKSRRTVHSVASLSESVASTKSDHDQKDASPRKMGICKRIKAFFNLKPPRQPKVFFHLIRHGEAYHNLGHEQGTNRSSFAVPDPSITQLGIQQALSLQQHLSTLHPIPTLILTSPLSRAIETALLLYPPASCRPKLQYIAYDDLRECGNFVCNKRAELPELRKRFGGRGLDLRALSDEPPVVGGEDMWSRAEMVRGELGEIAELLRGGGGFWKGVFVREALKEGEDRDVHVVVVSHGSFLKRLVGIPPGAEARYHFVPTELRSCELHAEGGLVETRESVEVRLATPIIWKL